MKNRIIPMNLQFFAENGNEGNEGNNSQQGNNQQGSNGGFQFDYDKLANIVAGKQSITEEKVLGGYFKQQGMTGEEVQQAINAFKEQKAKNTPDATILQNDLAESKKALMESKVNNQAIMEAVALGLDVKAIPYVLKMADMSKAADTEGNINAEEIKKALEKVLTDVPALKGTQQASNNANQVGGFQLGSTGNQNNQQSQEDMLRNIFGVKKS